jgi:hypothetical protein
LIDIIDAHTPLMRYYIVPIAESSINDLESVLKSDDTTDLPHDAANEDTAMRIAEDRAMLFRFEIQTHHLDAIVNDLQRAATQELLGSSGVWEYLGTQQTLVV